MSWTSFRIPNSIDVLLIHNNRVYAGSYEITNKRSGEIQMLTKDLAPLVTQSTAGTFDIKICNSFVYACTSSSIIKYDLDLNYIKEYKTSYMNTFLYIDNNLIYACTSQGSIDVYNLDLEQLYSVEVSNDILWTCIVKGDIVLCGGEDSILYTLKNKEVVDKKQFEAGITSLCYDDSILLIGSYDEHIYRIEDGKMTKHFIGGGVWRIKVHDNEYYLTCMYEEVKVATKKMFVNQHFSTRDKWTTMQEMLNKEKKEDKERLIYAMDICDDFLVYATFYGKIIYKLPMIE